MNKIDPILIDTVTTQSVDKDIQCVVYAYNYRLAKKYLLSIMSSNDIIDLPLIKAFGINTKNNNIITIAGLECVKYVSSVCKVSACVNNANDFLGTTNKLIKNNYNISIAVIDTGCAPHLDVMIPKRIINFIDLVNDKKCMYDDNGHGTFVTGVICGSGVYSGGKYQGIDKDTNIISIKALDKNGECGAINILKAMQWVYDNKRKYNIRVVCMSFGATMLLGDDPLIKGAEALWDSGIVVVCAAGNSGPNQSTIKSPGASSKIITVGALDTQTMRVADFSSRGPTDVGYKPDVVVPGVNVIGLSNKLNESHYTHMSGTSVATPMVAALCSNLIKENPKLLPNRVKSIIISRCTPISGDRNSEGYGFYDKNKD